MDIKVRCPNCDTYLSKFQTEQIIDDFASNNDIKIQNYCENLECITK